MRHQFAGDYDALHGMLDSAQQSGATPRDAAHTVASHVDTLQSDWTTLLAASMSTVAQVAAERLSAQTLAEYEPTDEGDAFTYDPDGGMVGDALKQQPSKTASLITDTTKAAILSALLAALEDNPDDPYSALDDTLSTLYDGWGDWRADTIGGDTTVGAWGLGEYDAASQLVAWGGFQVTRTWHATMDAHTRPEHAAADGQTVGLDEPFDVGGEQLMYPGSIEGSPSNTINCRCLLDWQVEAQ